MPSKGCLKHPGTADTMAAIEERQYFSPTAGTGARRASVHSASPPINA